jgi:hypothetical protein
VEFSMSPGPVANLLLTNSLPRRKLWQCLRMIIINSMAFLGGFGGIIAQR